MGHGAWGVREMSQGCKVTRLQGYKAIQEVSVCNLNFTTNTAPEQSRGVSFRYDTALSQAFAQGAERFIDIEINLFFLAGRGDAGEDIEVVAFLFSQ